MSGPDGWNFLQPAFAVCGVTSSNAAATPTMTMIATGCLRMFSSFGQCPRRKRNVDARARREPHQLFM
jgi:hypothetical protein